VEDAEMRARCEVEGCERVAYPCYFPESSTDEPDEYLCYVHAFERGFCKGCGRFWAGVGSFELGAGWCEHCQAGLDGDDDEEPDRYEEWGDEEPDYRF
jgi:hypothetical protein